MSEPLDESYFKWLYSKVADPEMTEPEMTYWNVLNLLFQKEFYPIVIAMDENRASDGKNLRVHFVRETHIPGVHTSRDLDPEWMDQGCSMLELMVGLSDRLAFEGDGKPHYWFWVLMDNLGLAGLSDKRRFTTRLIGSVDTILDDVINRTYEPSGKGGLFPLRNPRGDQRTKELWQQMNEYVLENLD